MYRNCSRTKFFSLILQRTTRSHFIRRVNESEKELWQQMYAPIDRQKYMGLPFLEFDLVETHLRYPDRQCDGLIAQQVGGSASELVFQHPDDPNYINMGDMTFWFNEPLGGWRQGIGRYYFLEELDVQSITWPKLARIIDGTLRSHMENFNEGDFVMGFCESIHLHHGICIDFGCNYVGLLPIDESTWGKIYNDLSYDKLENIRPDFDILYPNLPLTVFHCRIRRKLNPTLFRWPIELDILKPSWLKRFLAPVAKYEPKIIMTPENISDFNEQEYSRICGRQYRAPRCYAYQFSGHQSNKNWLQTQLDYYPSEHASEFVSRDISPLVPLINQQQEKTLGDLEMGMIIEDDGDLTL